MVLQVAIALRCKATFVAGAGGTARREIEKFSIPAKTKKPRVSGVFCSGRPCGTTRRASIALAISSETSVAYSGWMLLA